MDIELASKIATLVIGVVVAVGVPAIAWALRKFLAPRMAQENWRTLVHVAEAAWHIVEGVSEQTSWKGDDKLAEGLKQLHRLLARPLTDDEQAAAKTLFKRLSTINKPMAPSGPGHPSPP